MKSTNGTNRDLSTVVSIDRLSKTYPVPFLRLKRLLRRRFKPPVEALRDVSFDVHEGEIFGLIGPNGAGKTTLTKIIATLIQPTSGTVTVRGHDTVAEDRYVRSNVGLAGAEERSFYWRLTSHQNLVFFARLYGLGGKAALARIQDLFNLLDLHDVAGRRLAELSTGNRQRLAVARAMLTNPPLLLLDEPTRSLDPIAATRMRSMIKSLARANKTIFLTSHNLVEVEELCDRVAIISHGRIRALDTPPRLRATHTEKERVTISFSGRNLDDGKVLEQTLGPNCFDLLTDRSDEIVLSFERALNDDRLDRVLRVLHQIGAIVHSVQSQRATLLDVLESYQADEEITTE